MKVIAIALAMALFGPSVSALASPLTDSIAKSLYQEDMKAKAYIDQRNLQSFCEARKILDGVIADLETAVDQAADGKPIDMRTLESLYVVASSDDASWIILRKDERISVQHSLRVFCPR